ncbi:hypothetical protein CCZ01_00785 [Helicobacter monodelphidis]|uniref:hypothetical protein n=1 Tax=Helicobacter sp. 15-1451 TaxID=2004995 RepID=UPI000DCD2E54|nr:hypothetical protein [Helicobacter sp. 15-1451]RAX59304.1 hypothetical protein CCZ01_00785 [Helicobacter sp. 15-1451]
MSSLKECNILWLRDGETKYKDCEVYMSDILSGFTVRTKVDEALMYLKARVVDCVILTLGDKYIKDEAYFIQEVKKFDESIPVALCTNEPEEVINELVSAPLDLIVPLPLKLERLKHILTTLESVMVNHNIHASPPASQPLGVEDSINQYFQDEQKYLQSMEREGRIRKMSFEMMKRFILTAYNNFCELDVRLRDDRDLIKAHDTLFHALELQKILKRNVTAGMDYQYEKIYLMQHPSYLNTLDRLEQIALKTSIYHKELSSITSQMEEIKDRIRYVPNPDLRIELQKKYKQLNSLSTDHVHNISALKEEYDKRIREKGEIWNSEYKAFGFAFKRISEHYLHEYDELVDRLAYLFDRTLWIAARASRVITDFFEQGKIVGAFSSKAYMEYYLRNIDSELTKAENATLLNYRSQMEDENAIHIAIVGSDKENIKYESMLLESIDSYVKCRVYDATELLHFWKNAEKLDVIFFEDAIGRVIFYQFYKDIVQFYKSKNKQLPICYLICRYGKSPEKTSKLAFSLGVKASFIPPIGEEQLKSVLLELLT